MTAIANWPPPVSHLRRIDVYAYLDAGGDVLYIGQTWDLPTRHGAHRARSPWFDQVTDFALLGTYHNRRHALDAEAAAIRLHRPCFNVVHHPSLRRHQEWVSS